jgi:hypothetical protein
MHNQRNNMSTRTPIPIGSKGSPWLDRYGSKRAFEDAATTLTDSILALNDGRVLVGDAGAKSELTKLYEERRTHQSRLLNIGNSAGFDTESIDHSATESLRRAWLALKSGFTTDPGVIKVVTDVEQDAITRLEKAVGIGLPDAAERTVLAVISDMKDGVKRLERLESELAG